MGKLQDRVAIITGAGDGIGRGMARRFASEGARVVVAELDETSGPAVVDELAGDFGAEAIYVRTDVGVKDDNVAMVDVAVDRFGTVDILVNNAWGGGGGLGRVEFKTDETMDHALRVGFLGPMWAMQTAFPIMKAKGYGRVINICSLNGVNAHMGTADYNTAKEALRTLTRSAAREWASTGVVANVICPGALDRLGEGRVRRASRARSAGQGVDPHGASRRPRDRHRAGRGVPRERRLPLDDRQHALRGRRHPHQRFGVGARTSRRRVARHDPNDGEGDLMERFQDRRIIVTGGGSGIGRATVLRLLQEAGTVHTVDVDEPGLVRHRRAGRRRGHRQAPHDRRARRLGRAGRRHAGCARSVERFGGLDVLVNAAGILRAAHTHECTLDMWNQVINVNLTGTFLMCRAALPALLESDRGVIVNFSSTSAAFAHPYMAAYAASKGGIDAMTHTLAIEYGKQGSASPSTSRRAASRAGSPRRPAACIPGDADWGLFDKMSPVVAQGFGKPADVVASVIAMLASRRRPLRHRHRASASTAAPTPDPPAPARGCVANACPARISDAPMSRTRGS